MKQILAFLLCAVMLLLASCGIPEVNTASTEELQTQETVTTEIPPEDIVPTTPKLTVRENPSSDRKEDNIVPFGTTPGNVISRACEQVFPGSRADMNRLIVEGDRITHTPEMKTYVVDGYFEKAEKLLEVIESTTGFSFADPKIQLILGDAGTRHSDFDYFGCADTKYHIVQICQGDGFMGNSNELINLLAFVLQWDQAPLLFNDILGSGFAVYMTYDVLSQLEVTDPDFASSFAGSLQVCNNYYIFDPEMLCSKPIDFWMANGYTSSMTNGSAAVGFWLMKYLDDVYGDYTKWLTAYHSDSGELDVNGQIQLLKEAYGETVLDGFYPWVQNALTTTIPWDMIPDRTGLKEYVCYPMLTDYPFPQEIIHGEYADICVCLTQYRHYLTQVKEFTIDALTLIKYSDAEVLLYDAEGNFLQATQGTQVEEGTYLVSLDNAYYVRFPDAGYQYAMLDLEYTYP